MSLIEQTASMLPSLEAELQRQVARLDKPRLQGFYEMLTYHMGWTKDGNAREATGKRIRPLILLLVNKACGGKWLRAVPAAAAVELVHNFSLVHDDIQDHSLNRHGRSAVWHKYGIPLAINAGDALFVLSNLALMDLSKKYDAESVIRVGNILHQVCLELTCGQYLDMAYQKRSDMSIEDYWPMIEGKTAALLSACTQIGAILAEVDEATIEQYFLFGLNLGLAFQVQDDIIGIWGDEALTGKSTASDLLEGKNSLPVLYGINQRGKFARRWSAADIRSEEVTGIAEMLREEGALEFSQREAGKGGCSWSSGSGPCGINEQVA
jgi:geranylgeranyl diphosphate synthase type I